MQHYIGLDVSLKQTAVCVVDQTGKIKREGMVARVTCGPWRIDGHVRIGQERMRAAQLPPLPMQRSGMGRGSW